MLGLPAFILTQSTLSEVLLHPTPHQHSPSSLHPSPTLTLLPPPLTNTHPPPSTPHQHSPSSLHPSPTLTLLPPPLTNTHPPPSTPHQHSPSSLHPSPTLTLLPPTLTLLPPPLTNTHPPPSALTNCCDQHPFSLLATRIQQANLFNDPQSKCNILVATDAVGMGLNL